MTEIPEDTWPTETTRAANRAQAAALKAQAAEGGLRFDAYLPPELAEWLLDLIERDEFADPGEVAFVIFGAYRDLEPHDDLRAELLRRCCQASIDDPRRPLSADEVEDHFRKLAEAPLPEPAVWRRQDER